MSEIEFETLVIDNNYEISVDHYPYIIRNIKTKRVLKETINNDGYHQIGLHGKTYGIHRIVALQWIENDDPENKTQVDHINHDRSDNRIENLRWITPSDNNRNITKRKGIVYEFLDELSDEAFFVDMYNDHDYDDLLFDPKTNCFYIYTGAAYRELHYNKRKTGALFIHVLDIDNVQATISLNKFQRYFNLV